MVAAEEVAPAEVAVAEVKLLSHTASKNSLSEFKVCFSKEAALRMSASMPYLLLHQTKSTLLPKFVNAALTLL